MKKILLFFIVSVLFLTNLKAQHSEYKTLYDNTFLVMDKIIYSDINLDKIDDTKFLQLELKINEEEINRISQSIKSAGSSLKSSQNISEESCHNCDKITGEKVVEIFKYLRENKDEYEQYKTLFKGTWDIENVASGRKGCESYSCFAACCAVCAYTIPSVPIYLCCAYICYRDCCLTIVNPGGTGSKSKSY